MAVVVPEMRLFDDEGQRLYLTASERSAFLKAATRESREIRMLCHVYHYTGARSSEALEITPERIKINEDVIILRTLKKRKFDGKGRLKKPQFRQIPVPPRLIEDLDLVFNLLNMFKSKKKKSLKAPLWSMNRSTAYRYIKKVMARANINGPQATTKGLRHGFGIAMIEGGAPLTLVRDLMGHSDIKTTEIYLRVVGPEKRNLVMKAWQNIE